MNPYLTRATETLGWHARAVCAQDPELFFDQQRMKKALAVCSGCPVRTECREAADALGEKSGIWGGELRTRARSA
jgi:WhiB family redox-sensing transcriptional regulator